MVLRRDPKLQEALRHSRRVGDMLLKIEEQEMAKVNQLTDDLLKQEYRQEISYLTESFRPLFTPASTT